VIAHGNRAIFDAAHEQSDLVETVLDVDDHVTNVRLDERRFYSISTMTRLQEIQEYGPAWSRSLKAKVAAICGSYRASLASNSATTASKLSSKPSRGAVA
jgi:hypothetical protein